jgi:hypothetical protein
MGGHDFIHFSNTEEAVRAERDELEQDIETICSYLMEQGGWEEIDGDGDPGSIIVDHIARLLARKSREA